MADEDNYLHSLVTNRRNKSVRKAIKLNRVSKTFTYLL